MLDTELVRYLSFAGFAFLIFYVASSARERRKSGILKASKSANVHTAARVSWAVMFMVVAFALVVPPFYPSVVYWRLLGDGSRIVDVLQLLGFVLMLSGGLLLLWARRALGKFMRFEIMVTEGHKLVTEGPYRWIRHPAYTATMLLLVGLSLLYTNPVLGFFTATTAATAVYRARKEEDLLGSSDGFSKEYLEYKARTGRFLPKL